MSVEDSLFSQKMICPKCIKWLERKNGLFYCKNCKKYYYCDYSIEHLGETNVNKIKLKEKTNNRREDE